MLNSDRLIKVTKDQFETEFNIYKELWRIIAQTSHATTIIEDYAMGISNVTTRNNLRANKIKEAFKFATEGNDIIFLNKPFYSEYIYSLCVDVNMHCLTHLKSRIAQFDKGQFTDEIGSARLKRIIDPMILQIDKAIQKQIGFIKEAEIFE